MDGLGYVQAPKPHDSELHLARLPQPHRDRLARRVAAGPPTIGQSLFTYLVGSDRDLAERLLADGTITADDLLQALTGQRNEALERTGPLLLKHGIAPERIAAVAGFTSSWVGDDSAMHQHMLEYFDDLATRRPDLLTIAQTGRNQQTTLREAAAARERDNRVRGR